MSQLQWEPSLHQRVASAIRRAREPRSAQWLADRTAELGYPISRAQIANYESGRKKGLDLAEFLVIAAALDTAPVTLLYPGPYDQSVEMLPGLETPQFEAAQWFSGLMWIAGAGMGQGWNEATAELRSFRRLAEVELARKRAVFRHRKAGRPRESADELADELAMYDGQIQELRQHLGIEDDV
jgi:hypothetical protein